MRTLSAITALTDAITLMSGIVEEGNQLDSPLWTRGRNVEFTDGEVRKTNGMEVIRSLPSSVKALAQALVAGKRRIYAQTSTTAWMIEDEVLKNIGVNPTANGQVIPWGTWAVFNNGKTVPRVWKNSGTMVNLANVTFTHAKILLRWNPYLIAFNTSNGENWMEWCSDDDIEDWAPDVDNTARNLELRDLE